MPRPAKASCRYCEVQGPIIITNTSTKVVLSTCIGVQAFNVLREAAAASPKVFGVDRRDELAQHLKTSKCEQEGGPSFHQTCIGRHASACRAKKIFFANKAGQHFVNENLEHFLCKECLLEATGKEDVYVAFQQRPEQYSGNITARLLHDSSS